MDTDRRSLLQKTAYLAALAPFISAGTYMQVAQAQSRFGQTPEEAAKVTAKGFAHLRAYPGLKLRGTEKIAMLAYQDMTMLDLVGPQYFFGSMQGAEVEIVTKDSDLKPIMGDTGFSINPTLSFENCPADLDVLFVPGGLRGTAEAMRDKEIIEFLRDRGSRARFVTSVCTGALLLGQAGLLEGRRATTHWTTHHLLPLVGATPVKSRVVKDGNVITGAGVSAGLDFAIALLAEMRGEDFAKLIQLQAEYDPEPMFDAGSKEDLDPALAEPMHDLFARGIVAMQQAIEAHNR